VSGQKLAHNGGNVRFDFTPEDFEAIQEQAWDRPAEHPDSLLPGTPVAPACS
jgi:hypothetical protein